MKDKLSVAFLWHMHQPLYKDLLTGKYHLPWVRLHSTYSYLDMAAVIKDFPDIKCTFNLTPSLIWQLKDIADSDEIDDTYLELSRKKAADLDVNEKTFIIKNFFSCDYYKAVAPVKRYAELYGKRGEDISDEALTDKVGDFSDEEIRDLQVLFNLAWCGFTLRDKDRVVKELVKKASHFTEDEKLALLKVQARTVKSILPLYRKLQDEGRIEISTTPFYHPIIPLLCGSVTGYDFTKDARVQVDRAIELYEEVFGSFPDGMWPSEGSVSPEIVPIMEDAGIKWIATDEGILLESFRGQDLSREELIYKVFRAENGKSGIDIVFRDIHLSNAISFRYSNMAAKKASHDLCRDIAGIKKAVSSRGGEHLVSIILDGENPWPYYSGGGRDFLRALYSDLSGMSGIEVVTIGGYLGSNKERTAIPELYSGSWIDRNFRKWIGSPQKNKAWEYLEKARAHLFSSKNICDEALEELYIAEGSDWFWWYDEFGTELNHVFDDLFRLHLSNMYKLIGQTVPHYLEVPVPAGPEAKRIPEVPGPGEMVKPLNILFVSSEVVPFSKTGGLADVSGSLPRALASLGCDVRVVTPLYKCVSKSGFDIELEKRDVENPFKDPMPRFDLYSNRTGGLTTYFTKNDKYFARSGLYGTEKGDYRDNGCRFGFFSMAALAAAEAEGFRPDVIHCNDWQSALLPFYLRYNLSGDGFYRGIKTLFTIHNMAYQGLFPRKVMGEIGIPDSFFNMKDLEFYGKMSFMKSGILYSDALNTVSHRYAEEIMTPEYGCGLEGLLKSRKDVLYGIPNGVDYSCWSPKNDDYIKANYGPEDLGKKTECKKDLIDHTGLDLDIKAPLLGVVTRLAEQKGMDLLAGIAGDIVSLGAGLVVLGRGSDKYNRLFSGLADKYPGKVHVCNDFNEELAHKIEAGCDIFLMPSRYEPCGLNQMYSIKYGTIPVVRATGGLDDVIVDIDQDEERGNGFKFGPATEKALLDAIKRALKVYNEKERWQKLLRQAMSYDFSWDRSAEKYLALYRKLAG